MQQRGWSQEETGLSGVLRLSKTSFTWHFTRTCLHPKDAPSSTTLQEKRLWHFHLLICSVFIKVGYLLSTYYVSGTELGTGGTDNVPDLMAKSLAQWKDHGLQRPTYLTLDLRLWYVHAV